MKYLKSFICILAGFSIVSCNPKLYSPNTQNVPLISEKEQINLSAVGNTHQVEFQGAYGLTEHIAIQANGGLFSQSELNNDNGGSGKYIELGGGYFKPITENWIFETYGLVGIGNVENHLPSTVSKASETEGDISANILRVGVQPNFGYVSKYFSAAVSSRITNLSYSNIDGDLVYKSQEFVTYLNENKSNFLIEPAITVKAGLENVKFQVQYGYSLNLSNSHFRQDKMLLTMGLNFNL